MEGLGNVTGRVYGNNPPMWDEVWVCRKDRTKAVLREGISANWPKPPPDLDEYRRIVVE